MNVFELFAKLGLDASEYEAGLEQEESKGSKFGSGLKKAAGVAATAVTAATGAVVAFAGKSVQAGMDFDSAMSQVAATMGVTTDEIGNLRDFAQQMGSTTAFSATQAAEALNYMALAGYDADTSMSMLPTVLDLAAAGGMDLATASDMVTDASSALGLSIDETAQMVDKMAAASSNTNTSVSQLGEAMLAIGGTAKYLVGGTTELSTVLGIMADNGIKGAEGGTHLRNILLSLTAPTDTAAGALEELGVSALDADGNMRPLEDVFADLNAAMSDMSTGEQADVLSKVFNKTDLTAVNALLSTTHDRWAEVTNAIDQSQGAAEQMSTTQLDNLAGDITLFKSALEGAQIAISDSLSPELREFVQFGASSISSLTEAFKEGGLSGAMGELGNIIADGAKMLLEHAPDFVNAGMQLLSALGQGFVDNIGLVADTGATILVQIAEGIAGNIDTIVPAIVSVITTLVSTFSDPAVAVPLTKAGIQIIVGIISGLAQATPELVGMIPMVIGNLILTVQEVLPDLGEAVLDILGALGFSILGAIGGLMGMSFDEISDGFLNLDDALVDFGGNVLLYISGLWTDITSGITTFFTDLGTNVSSGFNNALDTVKGWGSDVWDAIKGTFDNVVSFVGDCIDDLIGMFDFDWSLPQIKLPHFKISGGQAPWGFAGQGTFPSVQIQWYKKAMDTPYMLDSATIFGAANGQYMGGGEAGSEMIYSHEKLMGDIGAVVNAALDNLVFPINVFIGQKKIDQQVVTATAKNNVISGGR